MSNCRFGVVVDVILALPSDDDHDDDNDADDDVDMEEMEELELVQFNFDVGIWHNHSSSSPHHEQVTNVYNFHIYIAHQSSRGRIVGGF